MNGARLLSLEIEGFRGFAEGRPPIDLDADAIVVRGDNGTGKTSLVDALLWVLCGELAHLTTRLKGLRKGEDAVKSRFNPSGASVTLRLRSPTGELVTIARTGSQKASQLAVSVAGTAVVDAEEAVAVALGLRSYAEVRQAVPSWGVLRQDHIRAALDVAGGQLHERLSSIVGLEKVSAFAAACDQAANDVTRERNALRRSQQQIDMRVSDAHARHDAAAAEGGSDERVQRTLIEGLGALNEGLAGAVVLYPPAEASLEAITQLGRRAADLLAALETVVDCRAALTAVEGGSDDALTAASEAVAEAARTAEAARVEAPLAVQLAQAALPLLGDECPVCGQKVEPESVRAHLEEILASAQRLVDTSEESQRRLADAQRSLEVVRAAAERRREGERALAAAQAGLADAVSRASDAVRLDPDASAADLADSLRSAVQQLRELYRQAQEVSGAHAQRLEAEARALEAEAAESRARLDGLERRLADAKRLQQGAHEASQRIVERALRELAPSFAEVFDRLKPNPAFTELDVRQDVINNKNQVLPVVRDPDRGVEANPSLVFSEGQLNVVALSYFLGMALNARDAAVPFLVLDDPLQALDVIAMLGFSDLCRRIRDQRQLIVTTHDRRFADVLVRKLSPRESGETLVVHDFDAWTREGPQIRTNRPEFAPIVPLLRRAS